MQTSQFFSKILLFGEYGIIKGSKGLSIPYDSYSGFLSILDQGTNENKVSHNNLLAFSEYLKKINNEIFVSADYVRMSECPRCPVFPQFSKGKYQQ